MWSGDLLEAFREIFDEFQNVSDAKINLAIDEAMILAGEDKESSYQHWQGEKHYKYALLYLSAHITHMNTSPTADAASGVITSKSAGGVSISRSAPASSGHISDMGLDSTKYGQKYLALRYQKIIVGKSA